MIKGEKINLRLVREADLDTLFELESDLENRGDYYPAFLNSEAKFKRRFAETGYWTEKHGRFLVVDKTDRILGDIEFFKSVPYFNALEIAYILFDQESRGQGVMSEALSLLVQYLFETKPINRLYLTVVPGNIASKRVAEKCGFQFEGLARGAMFHQGRHTDMEIYGATRADFEALS